MAVLKRTMRNTSAAAADRMPTIWEERSPVLKKYRLSVRRLSMAVRPTPYHRA